MKDSLINRRRLISLAVLTSSTAALSTPLSIIDFLKSSEGELKVKAIVRKYFAVAEDADPVLGAFYRSLLVGESHREDRKFLMDHLERKELEERLEVYVIEEFIVSTNYLHVLGGEASSLKMRVVLY
ncbi:MAG: hypothetical protein EOP04_14705 [Proteobacteria bacterium]|nr:MAG: hypothetical protein EOP04_14705 [Pseudomonadota bacterium]